MCVGGADCNIYKESKAIIYTMLKTFYNPMGENSREINKERNLIKVTSQDHITRSGLESDTGK